MRIFVHDFSGHPFQIQLSRTLARRGHSVLHAYAARLQTPRGPLEPKHSDPISLRIRPVDIGEEFKKYSLIRRWSQEHRYGRKLAEAIIEFKPQVVLSANTPLGAQASAIRAARRVGARFVYWLQDILSIGIDDAVRDRLPIAGAVIGEHYRRFEKRLLSNSDAVVAISTDFQEFLKERRVPVQSVGVIENWAPIEDFPVKSKENPWSVRHGLADKFCFLYSGTLGLKHNSRLLLSLAQSFRNDSRVRVVVVSEGPSADQLRLAANQMHLDNLEVIAFQRYQQLPDVLASGDVLVTVLEETAGRFSVPSKVMTYLCSGRPILAAVPSANLAARVLLRSGAGLVVEPSQVGRFVSYAERLRSDPELRSLLGKAGRVYSEVAFAIDPVADQFEEILTARHASVQGLRSHALTQRRIS